MKYVKRLCWLAAWGVWLWLGFGLYRELPRDYGKAIATIPANGMSIGFIGDTNLFAIKINLGGDRTSVDAYDAETGALIYSTPGPKSEDYVWASWNSRKYPVLLAKDVPNAQEKGWSLLDLKTGKWRWVSRRNLRQSATHLEKPWVLVFDANGDDPPQPQPVVVIDWETGKETLVCEIPPTREVVGRMFFIDEGDRIGFQIGGRRASFLDGFIPVFEIWKLQDPPVLEKRHANLPLGRYPTLSSNGRVAIEVMGGDNDIEVHDLIRGGRLFAHVRTGDPIRSTALAELSCSGRTLFDSRSATLWDMESGAVVWKSDDETYVDDWRNRFFVREQWDKHWKRWLPNLKYETFAARDLETASLVARMAVEPANRNTTWNAAGTLAMGMDRTSGTLDVYRIPNHPPWLTLALCQAILALPLLLLWTLLRWRAARRQPAVASNPPVAP